MKQERINSDRLKIDAAHFLMPFPVLLSRSATFFGLLMLFTRIFFDPSPVFAQNLNDGAFKVVRIGGGSLSSSLPEGTFKWSAHGGFPARD